MSKSCAAFRASLWLLALKAFLASETAPTTLCSPSPSLCKLAATALGLEVAIRAMILNYTAVYVSTRLYDDHEGAKAESSGTSGPSKKNFAKLSSLQTRLAHLVGFYVSKSSLQDRVSFQDTDCEPICNILSHDNQGRLREFAIGDAQHQSTTCSRWALSILVTAVLYIYCWTLIAAYKKQRLCKLLLLCSMVPSHCKSARTNLLASASSLLQACRRGEASPEMTEGRQG